MIFPPDHPYFYIRQFVDSESQISDLVFSFYFYRPQSLVDERKVIIVARDSFLDTEEFLSILEKCPANFEVAFHSTIITKDGETLHIPMIDMSTGARAQLDKLDEHIGKNLFDRLGFFESGRSFHVYGNTLFTEKEWMKFMGELLLSNKKDLKPLVDPRWIGHRLIAGYSALRWTKNTEHYLSLPKIIKIARNP
jgi:hypothetical protein